MPPTAEPRCPQCQAPLDPAWDWCGVCGYDPLGLRPTAEPAGEPAGERWDAGDHGAGRSDDADPPPGTDRDGLRFAIGVLLIGAVALAGGLALRTRADAPPAGPGPSLAASATDWRVVRPAGAGFQAQLPTDPTVTDDVLALGRDRWPARRYTSTDGPDALAVTVVEVPEGTSLDRVATDLTAAYGAPPAAATHLNVGNHPAVDWTIELPDGRGRVVSRAVLGDRRVWLVQATGTSPPPDVVDRLRRGFGPTG